MIGEHLRGESLDRLVPISTLDRRENGERRIFEGRLHGDQRWSAKRRCLMSAFDRACGGRPERDKQPKTIRRCKGEA
jgi:hypothetical protein